MIKPTIIAVSAVSGGGKTTIVTELTKILKPSKSLHFDEYDFEGAPDNFYNWIKEGADYNTWNLTPLIQDINNLINQEELHYIILDYPFSYKNKSLSACIDCTIFIDTPLDIAMSRRILRDKTYLSPELMKLDMTNYVYYGRIAYQEMLDSILPNSDIAIDGNLSIDEIVNEIIQKLPLFLTKGNN